MGNVNRYPVGLLSLLDTQTQGVAPDTLGQTIQAVIEMSPWHMASQGVVSSVTSETLLALGIGSGITVPDNEMWWLIAASVEAFSLDAAVSYCIPCLRMNTTRGGGTGMVYAYNNQTAGNMAIGASRTAVFAPALPLILSGGCVISPQISFVNGAPVNGWSMVTTAHYYRMKN